MNDIQIFEVGGAIRDELMGLDPKTIHDRDFVITGCNFEEMQAWVETHMSKIFMTKPQFLTIRAKQANGKTVDFVLARKESNYDGRHPNTVEAGTLEEDLSRRDFTVNALARPAFLKEGNMQSTNAVIVDLFGGIKHLEAFQLVPVNEATTSMKEDGLRIYRAIRFSITKGLIMNWDLMNFFRWVQLEDYINGISKERIQEELDKCFRFSTFRTLQAINRLANTSLDPFFLDKLIPDQIWLKPTLERR